MSDKIYKVSDLNNETVGTYSTLVEGATAIQDSMANNSLRAGRITIGSTEYVYYATRISANFGYILFMSYTRTKGLEYVIKHSGTYYAYTVSLGQTSATASSTDNIWTTVYSNSVVKNGNVVNISVGGVTASPVSVTPNSTVLCKIPEGFRPNYPAMLLMYWRATTSGEVHLSVAEIRANGEVVSRHGSTATNMQNIMITASYGASNF